MKKRLIRVLEHILDLSYDLAVAGDVLVDRYRLGHSSVFIADDLDYRIDVVRQRFFKIKERLLALECRKLKREMKARRKAQQRELLRNFSGRIDKATILQGL